MRRFPKIALLIAIAAITSLVVAGVAHAKLDPWPKRIKGEITRALTKRGYDVKQVLPCRKRGPAKYRCEWRVSGSYSKGPNYSCSGFATYYVNRPARRLQLDSCLNEELWDLLRAGGLHPKAILNPKVERGIHRFEWRAEGMRAGGVPYRCKDVAKYNSRSGEWTLGQCANEIQEAEPLMDQPGPRPIFGFHDEWADPDNLSRAKLAAGAGASVIRFNLVWSIVEQQNNSFNWAPYDAILNQVFAAGLKPMLVVIGAPCWAAESSKPPCPVIGPPSASHVDDYADFAAAVAKRYPKALGIEVWNEPNWSEFWIPKPDPARYADMVRQTAAAVDATGTNVPVVVAGMAPLANSSDNGGKVAVDEFMRAVFAAGGIGSADAVGSHIYFGDVEDFLLNARQQIARLRQVMTANGRGGAPIWITEYGISSSEEANEQTQGKLLMDLYETFRRMANIPVVIAYRMFDDGSDHRGVIAANGERKPAYCVVASGVGASPAGC
jgi:hypothetical protein